MEYTECRTFAESIMERAKTTMKADGHLAPLFFAMGEDGNHQVVALTVVDGKLADVVKAAVKQTNAFAAVVVNEQTFAHIEQGEVQPDDVFNAIAVACVHPKGHAVWVTPYAIEHGVTFGKTRLMEGENFSGPITEILK